MEQVNEMTNENGVFCHKFVGPRLPVTPFKSTELSEEQNNELFNKYFGHMQDGN